MQTWGAFQGAANYPSCRGKMRNLAESWCGTEWRCQHLSPFLGSRRGHGSKEQGSVDLHKCSQGNIRNPCGVGQRGTCWNRGDEARAQLLFNSRESTYIWPLHHSSSQLDSNSVVTIAATTSHLYWELHYLSGIMLRTSGTLTPFFSTNSWARFCYCHVTGGETEMQGVEVTPLRSHS